METSQLWFLTRFIWGFMKMGTQFKNSVWENTSYLKKTHLCPSLLLVWMFILRATRLSNKLLEQGYVKERLKSSLRKFYGRYGDLIKKYEVSLSQMLNDILWPDHIQWQPPTDQTLYRARPFTEFWVVSIEHLWRVWHADRGRLLLRTPGPVPLGLAYVLLVETNPFPNLSLFFRTMLFEYPSVLSRFYFAPGLRIPSSKFFRRTMQIAANVYNN